MEFWACISCGTSAYRLGEKAEKAACSNTACETMQDFLFEPGQDRREVRPAWRHLWGGLFLRGKGERSHRCVAQGVTRQEHFGLLLSCLYENKDGWLHLLRVVAPSPLSLPLVTSVGCHSSSEEGLSLCRIPCKVPFPPTVCR